MHNLDDDLQLTSTVGTRRQLRSADSPTLVVRSTRRSTLGDRAFPVAAERAWNSLPPAVRDAPSLLSFRSRFKTLLFELTLAWHWLHSPAALHFVCVFSNSVKCPCNVTHDSVTLIFTILIIIIYIYIYNNVLQNVYTTWVRGVVCQKQRLGPTLEGAGLGEHPK